MQEGAVGLVLGFVGLLLVLAGLALPEGGRARRSTSSPSASLWVHLCSWRATTPVGSAGVGRGSRWGGEEEGGRVRGDAGGCR
jgi:hypothetical protein